MVSLKKYSGAETLPQTRVPTVQPDTAIANAAQNLGSDLAQAGGAIAEHFIKKQAEFDNFQKEKGLLDFSSSMNQKMLDATQDMKPGAQDFSKNLDSEFSKQSEAFLKGLPESVQKDAQLRIASLKNKFSFSTAKTELSERKRYYSEETDKALDGLSKSIRNNPASYDEALKQGQSFIDASGLSRIEKELRKDAWKRMASIAYLGELPLEERKKIFATPRENYFAAVKQSESGGNPNAKNPMPGQTATGLYQFTEGTWKGLMRSYPNLGLTAGGRTDPVQQEKAMRVFTENNAKVLSSAGIETSNANLYMAHFFGAQGAVHVLSQPDSARMADIVSPAIIKANPILRGKTVGDIKAWTAKKMGASVSASNQYQDQINNLTYQDMVKLQSQTQRDIVSLSAQINDELRLAIEMDPTSVSYDDILSSDIDTGQQAARWKQLETALKDVTKSQQAMDWAQNGGKGNPFDSEDKKFADAVFTDLTEKQEEDPQKVAESIVEAKGVVPKGYVNMLRNGLQSANVTEAASAAAQAYRLNEIDPQALRGVDNGNALIDAATSYRMFKNDMGMNDQQIGQKLVAMNDPATRETREALLKSDAVKQQMKKVDRSFVASQMSIDSGRVFDYDVGVNDAAGDAIAATYRQMYQEAIVDMNGDLELAAKLTTERFKKHYGPSEFIQEGNDIVVPFPPEKTYPPLPDGTHDYIGTQLEESLKSEIGDFEEVYLAPFEAETAKAARLGVKVPYLVQYMKDGKLNVFPHPFYADYEAGLAAFSGSEVQEMQERRDAFEVPSAQPEGLPMVGAEQGRAMQTRDEEMRAATEAYRGAN